MKIHDESKAFPCDIFLKIFLNNTLLTRLYKTYTGEKSFACQISDLKLLKNLLYLVQHQAAYSEIRIFKSLFVEEIDFLKYNMN